MDPLILTAELDPVSFSAYDALRQAHFPDRGYVLPAHLTLFHNLPGEALDEIAGALTAIAARTPPLPLRFASLFGMGRGVAVAVEAPGLKALRSSLAALWEDALTPQDRKVRLHVTVQNKVAPEAARALLSDLSAGFEPHDGTCTGLLLWHYRGGPWDPAGRFPFSAAGSSR